AALGIVGIERRQIHQRHGLEQPGELVFLLDRPPRPDGRCAALQRGTVHPHPPHPVEIERKAGIALVADARRRRIDDLETHISSTSAGIRRLNFSAPYLATSLVCSCEMVSAAIPAPILVIEEHAQTRIPRNRPRITSGTVDIPTALAPSVWAMRISAGVSKLGPEYHI